MTDEQEYLRTFQMLKSLDSLDGLQDGKALHYLACLVDLAVRYEDPESTDKALAWASELDKRKLSESDQILLSYYTANAWGDKQNLRHRNADAAWQWDQPETLNQIQHLRSARRHPHFEKWDRVRQAQVLTNLGNQFDTLGRFVEALAHWNAALAVKPAFGMARGNRGTGLYIYANLLFDPHHRAPFYVAAYRDLEFALSSEASYEGYGAEHAKNAFKKTKDAIASFGDINDIEQSYNLTDFSLGRSKAEQKYRKWALSEGLFLNPLNDLGAFPAAAADTFVLPTFVTKLSEPPTWLGFFNQLKQEYVSARWTLFEGTQAKNAHFSDRYVTLYNTLDYPVYGVGAERVRMAFRMSYSLLDKIGIFLNDYMNLRIPEKRVYFRTIWFKRDTKVLRDEFTQLKNLPWRGLYWLAKDLFDETLNSTADPDAQELYTLRNRLEHSYLKLHDIGSGNKPGDLFHDRMAHSLGYDDFERRTLRVLKLSRAALIYLALGMEREERSRAERDTAGGLSMPMTMETFRDKWKR
ncbi:LA2681 family HEPN domain-containing protein [Undibacter mobilis]|uniref:LA2681-like HEPN domain-containing protein n=1 Tax=Undibacter mobilis TaxID=2292256 RepID=A0A371BAT0_9BRAD|nr:LA2681 family HEPN domain-containing protein [Undibacter mobilis]RDV04503.1 hypothetical protein DXH78_07965 [Undibacter mobilis]